MTAEPPSFTCPDCGRTSYHPQDVAHRYCGACHTFPEDRMPDPTPPGPTRGEGPDRPMTDEERLQLAARIGTAQHAMQSATAFEIERLGLNPAGADPKHLRVGVNSALVNIDAIARVLITKGLMTEREYLTALAVGAEREAERSAALARQRTGLPNLTFG
jgi:hypothetical protein